MNFRNLDNFRFMVLALVLVPSTLNAQLIKIGNCVNWQFLLAEGRPRAPVPLS